MPYQDNDVEAHINAILDITDDNFYKAVELVCRDIEIKEAKPSNR